MRRAFFAALFALTTALFGTSAQAEMLDFSYLMPDTGNVVAGSVDGTLLSDGNVFDLSSFLTLSVNGISVALPTTITTPDKTYANDNTPAAMSLDGSYLNVYATDSTNILAFAVGDVAVLAGDIDGNQAGGTPGYGGGGDYAPYVQSNWTASLESVPEPSSILLMLAPLALLVSIGRFARRAV
jgi:hypothetical protein